MTGEDGVHATVTVEEGIEHEPVVAAFWAGVPKNRRMDAMNFVTTEGVTGVVASAILGDQDLVVNVCINVIIYTFLTIT